ncbi:MAG TPA: MotA/TolQ/ExbB proton channel family protein [Verrucomicrobiae bacterium]|nr:MotA/TolQ/ExbB proton channel family protein [Verrucomicrobiae bacterium]
MNAMMNVRIVRTAALAAILASGVVAAQEEKKTPAAPPAAPPVNAAQSLQQLLDQTRNARAQEAQQNAAREQQFAADRNRQAGMLAQARGERTAQQNRSNQLSAQFDANEKRLTELQAVLDAKGGNLGELFGVVRIVAGDVGSVLYNSLITAQYPKREVFVQELAQAKGLPSIDKLEKLWFEMQREMTETGRSVKFQGKVVEPEGEGKTAEVARVGPFVAVSEDRFLQYLPSQYEMTVMPRQPDSPYPGLADDFAEASSGYDKMVVDPARGTLLALVVSRPTIIERIHQGEFVGYVIIVVGIIGAVLAAMQFLFLIKEGVAVRRQLQNTDRPTNDNALGRVLSSFKGDASKVEENAEVVELRISEAVLREVPKLERYQSFLSLAVAAGPLLGLVGTVIGMIITFQSITESGSGDPKLMAAGISQAMIATVLGLGIAVPLLFMNAALKSRSRAIIQVLDEQSTGLLAERLERTKGPKKA